MYSKFKLQFWWPVEYLGYFHCHYSQVHFQVDWLYLLLSIMDQIDLFKNLFVFDAENKDFNSFECKYERITRVVANL